VGYREFRTPPPLRDLVECAWRSDAGAEAVRILPDGCMDLIATSGHVVVAGPDTTATIVRIRPEPLLGLRFRPGALPRLLGVPAHELQDQRVRLDDVLGTGSHAGSLVDVAVQLAGARTRIETAPWSMAHLAQITGGLAAGATVADLATATGMSSRTLQRRCRAVYGYGPSTLRRILRFRRAVALMRSGHALAEIAADAGYSDQPHLHREAREFSGLQLSSLIADQLGRGANKSMDVPSGSVIVA
jgi:AraC-like DNA-binding protein